MNACSACGYPFLVRGTLCTGCSEKSPMAPVVVTEHTDQGEQIVLPGAERSARQAAAYRGWRMTARVKQRDPGGLFEPAEKKQLVLF